MRRPPRDDFKRANQLAPGVQWIEGNRTRQARGAAAKLKGVEQLGYPTKAGRPSGRQSDPPALPGRCYGYTRAVQQRVIRGYATMQGLAALWASWTWRRVCCTP